jgi:hypothetical protein
MNSLSPLHPDLTEKDMENARAMLQGLLDDVRRRERERQLLAAIITWANAFSSFKRLRKNVGLPVGPQSTLFYGGILASLKATGKMLMAWAEREKCDPAITGIRREDIKAAVDELIEDDVMLETGLLEADFSDYEKRFCGA